MTGFFVDLALWSVSAAVLDCQHVNIPANNIVLITGAASGIGRHVAERFLAQGDRVHICDVDGDKVEEFLRANETATGTVADIASRADVERVFADLIGQYGGLNTLVNNAEDGWDRCLAVNLAGTFYVTRRAVPLLKKALHASIINISSTAALHGYPLRSAYVASKWAMIGLTKTWAMELGREGIRVNAVCPTSVSGPRIDAVIERGEELCHAHVVTCEGRGQRRRPSAVSARQLSSTLKNAGEPAP